MRFEILSNVFLPPKAFCENELFYDLFLKSEKGEKSEKGQWWSANIGALDSFCKTSRLSFFASSNTFENVKEQGW